MNEELIAIITEEIIRQLGRKSAGEQTSFDPLRPSAFEFADPDALVRMKKRTTAQRPPERSWSRKIIYLSQPCSSQSSSHS